MAYASKELKAKVIDLIKTEAKAKDIKITLNTKIVHDMRLVVNVSACSIDLKQNLLDTLQATLDKLKAQATVGSLEIQSLERMLKANLSRSDAESADYGLDFNVQYLDRFFSGEALDLVRAVVKSIKCDYFNNSDLASDYFDVSYYWDLKIGKNKGGFKVKV